MSTSEALVRLPLDLTRAERERLGSLLRRHNDLTGGDEEARALALRVDPWHDVHGSPTETEAVVQLLRAWRSLEARARQVPPYIIATDAILRAIADANPPNLEQLGVVRGMGAHKVAAHGEAILRVLRST